MNTATLTNGSFVMLQVPSDTIYSVYGTLLFEEEQSSVNISVGNTIWSQSVGKSQRVPFQTICRAPTALLLTGLRGRVSVTYTATPIRASTTITPNAAVPSIPKTPLPV